MQNIAHNSLTNKMDMYVFFRECIFGDFGDVKLVKMLRPKWGSCSKNTSVIVCLLGFRRKVELTPASTLFAEI